MEVVDYVLFIPVIMDFFRLAWKRSSNISNFPDFPPNVGIVVVGDSGNLENQFFLIRKFAYLLLFANC